MKNVRTHAEDDKTRRFFQLRDILILVALLLSIHWLVILALAFWLFSVILQLRNDWKNYRKFDLFTIIYICVASAIIFLNVFQVFLR